jgi:hypothetical protein
MAVLLFSSLVVATNSGWAASALLVCLMARCCCLPAGVNQPLWSHSYLGYGFDVVQSKVNSLVRQLAAGNGSSTHATSSTQAAAAAAGGSSALSAGHLDAAAEPAAAGQAGSSVAVSPHASGAVPVHVGAEGVVDPCLPAGYNSHDGRVGSGVWQQCQQLVEAVIDPRACKPVQQTPCPELPDGMPKLTGELGGGCVCTGQHQVFCESRGHHHPMCTTHLAFTE